MLICVLTCALREGQGQFELSIIHVNDIHAHYEPVSVTTGTCKEGENEQGEISANNVYLKTYHIALKSIKICCTVQT